MASSLSGWRWPDTENAHGSPPDWCQISACMIFGSTVRGSNERGEVHGVHPENDGHERQPGRHSRPEAAWSERARHGPLTGIGDASKTHGRSSADVHIGSARPVDEAELTDRQGRALSGHRTRAAYAGYAKRTLARALPTRKRYAHMKAALAPLALDATDTTGTGVQNDARKIVQNDNATDKAALA
jgi:hypothetical protein